MFRQALKAVAALSVTAVAVVLTYRNNRNELETWFPVLAAATAPNALDPDRSETGMVRSRLIVQRVGKGVGDRLCVTLESPTGPRNVGEIEETDQGILEREIVRQAVLIAARDELGVSTRDLVLGDAPPAGRGSAIAEVAAVFRRSGVSRLELSRDREGHSEVLLKKELSLVEFERKLGPLVNTAEALSRSEFPEALKALGIQGRPNAIRAETGVSGSIEDRLAGLGFVDVFAAVCELHASIRDDGESPARLGALVRGYALLGVLSEFHWSPAHKAFKARALLYAQRLHARAPESPWGLWHRAFAEALAGMHGLALNDLGAARALAKAEGVPAAPAWVDLIDASCHYDLDRMKIEDGPLTKLASLLRMCAVEIPTYFGVALRAAREVLALDPECFRAHDVMCQVGGVSNLHVATMIAPQVLTQIVPLRLRGMATVPAGVRDRLDRQAGEIAMVEALDRAGEPGDDPGELSWGVLGHLIRETRFVHVWRRLAFMRNVWCVPVDDFWAEVRPSVAKHRFRPYLDTLALPAPAAEQARDELIATLDLTSLEMTEGR